MANYWMHNGFLQVEGEKMSKSLGNFVTIHELLKDWPGEVVRFTMLQTHYRQPINWTVAGLARGARRTSIIGMRCTADAPPGYLCADALDALLDDLNTPKAFAALHELRGEAAKGAKPAAACLKASAQLIGLLQMPAAAWAAFRPASLAIDENKIVNLIGRAQRRAQGEEFQGIRPHPRRTRRHGRRAQGFARTAPPGRSRDDARRRIPSWRCGRSCRPIPPLLREIFRDSIADLTDDDYTPAQQDAWASSADDEAAFGKRLGSHLTLVATLAGSPVGFASLAGGTKIDMLYVHPAAAGQGVGAMLIDALEKLAGARGAAQLTVDASDSARGFFEKRGYVAQQRNTVSVGDEWLANTTLHKQLAAKREAS